MIETKPFTREYRVFHHSDTCPDYDYDYGWKVNNEDYYAVHPVVVDPRGKIVRVENGIFVNRTYKDGLISSHSELQAEMKRAYQAWSYPIIEFSDIPDMVYDSGDYGPPYDGYAHGEDEWPTLGGEKVALVKNGGEVMFWGSSDDLIEIDGAVTEEISAGVVYGGSYVGSFTLAGGGEIAKVHVLYDGTWSFAYSVYEEGESLPDWSATTTASEDNDYSALLRLTVPPKTAILWEAANQ